MRFLTLSESQAWCEGIVALGPDGRPLRPSAEPLYAKGPLAGNVPSLTAFCRQLERALQPREACLLWVTDWGIWGSSENWHLYYRLRQSYGDPRLLHEAPGHLFLDYESADLVSFLQVGVLSGWDMHLIPMVGYARAFVSHDEYVEFVADDADGTRAFAAELAGARVEPASDAA